MTPDKGPRDTEPRGPAGRESAWPLVIGWKEYLDFPEWGLRHVRVKVDTGAWSSALDVAGCEIEETDQGPVARLLLELHRRPGRAVAVRAPVLRRTLVRNTGGQCEERPVIETLIRLGLVEKRIRVTVANRSGLRYRMILGRQALAGSFVVDVSRKYVLRP
jgi:hypothetical protein